MIEEAIAIATVDGQADGFLYRPALQGRWPGAVFFTDGLGIRQAKREMAARLSARGYVVLLPNLFYREGVACDLAPPELDENPDITRERFGKYARNISKNGGLPRDIGAYLDFLTAHENVRNGKLGCTGYCMGGYFSIKAAGWFPEKLGAIASFHGGALATDSPESPHRRAHAMRSQIYVGVAGIDPYLHAGETDRLRGALEGAAVSHRMELYENAEHGFTVPTNREYDEVAAERHWQALFNLFKRAL